MKKKKELQVNIGFCQKVNLENGCSYPSIENCFLPYKKKRVYHGNQDKGVECLYYYTE